MCGRFLLDPEDGSEDVRRFLTLASALPEQEWSAGEIAPGMRYPVLIEGTEKAGLSVMRWGFPNPRGGLLINARSESVSARPTFAQSFADRRCAILVSAYFEWSRGAERRKYRFSAQAPLYLAGLWDRFDGEERYVILTRAAAGSMCGIHDRMPVLLPRALVLPYLRSEETASRLLLRDQMDVTAELAG